MSNDNETLEKFKPERPIYLNEDNTGLKTKAEVLVAIAKLRDKHWLCAYGEKVRPFHMSFNDENQFQEFKKCANDLDIKLKSPIIKDDDLEALEAEEKAGQVVPGANATNSYQDASGKTHNNASKDKPVRTIK